MLRFFQRRILCFKLPVLVTFASLSPGSCSYFGVCRFLNPAQERSIKVPVCMESCIWAFCSSSCKPLPSSSCLAELFGEVLLQARLMA